MPPPAVPPAKEIDFEVVAPRAPVARTTVDEWLRLLAFAMDNLVRIPGTGRRFGLDPIIGLIPGLGDGTTGVAGVLTILRAAQRGVPRLIIARMALNILLDSGVGAIPVAGDAFSFWFKSFQRNYQLLEEFGHGRTRPPTLGDRLFVWTFAALAVAVPLAAIVLMSALWYQLFKWLFG
ncbi:MAG: DUF4112 domain-containing protein [Verrucomicrobia bacterium]|nr:DUF4112 domain-containing protein [Verrucomicrobiota bacterium]